MNPKHFLWVFLIFAAASCGRSGKMQRDQQQYDVVQEGSATGVTSTINAPGENPPPPMTSSTITGTNVDTTTAFTLPGTATTATTTQQPGTVAGTFPTTPTPRPRPRATQPTTNPPMNSSTDTAAPTATDTVAPTKEPDKKKDEHKPPPPTDTTATGTQGLHI
jgi:hypothetical protein